MYPIENSSDLIKNKRKMLLSRAMWAGISRTVVYLGLTSLLTDISSEMVTAILPLYLLLGLGLAPLQFGLIDGINQGASVLVRVASGLIADRLRRVKEVATSGYLFSAICRIGLLLVGRSWLAISGVVLLDRIGKGIRTGPRDAMIAASSNTDKLATAFGVHRAMDTAGAMTGPLLAAGLLVMTPGRYSVVFIVSLCFAVVGVAVIGLLVESPVRETTAEASKPVSAQIISELLQQPNFRTLMIVSSILALMTLSDSFIFLAIQRTYQLSLTLFPLLYVGVALIYMILAIPIGRLADRWGRRSVFLGGFGFLAAVYGLLLVPGLPKAFAFGILALQGLYYAATDGVLAALASAMLPEQWRTTGLAILATGVGLARFLGSLGYGAAWSFFGPNPAIVIFLMGLGISLLFAWLFMSRMERAHDETRQ